MFNDFMKTLRTIKADSKAKITLASLTESGFYFALFGFIFFAVSLLLDVAIGDNYFTVGLFYGSWVMIFSGIVLTWIGGLAKSFNEFIENTDKEDAKV